jgi:hypothetical protein
MRPPPHAGLPLGHERRDCCSLGVVPLKPKSYSWGGLVVCSDPPRPSRPPSPANEGAFSCADGNGVAIDPRQASLWRAYSPRRSFKAALPASPAEPHGTGRPLGACGQSRGPRCSRRVRHWPPLPFSVGGRIKRREARLARLPDTALRARRVAARLSLLSLLCTA